MVMTAAATLENTVTTCPAYVCYRLYEANTFTPIGFLEAANI